MPSMDLLQDDMAQEGISEPRDASLRTQKRKNREKMASTVSKKMREDTVSKNFG